MASGPSVLPSAGNALGLAEAGRARLDNLQVTDESNGGLRRPPRAEVSEMNSQATAASPLRKRTDFAGLPC